jgi:hypothetical protein
MNKKILLGLLLVSAQALQAFAPTSLFKPWDPNFRLEPRDKNPFRIGMNVEYSTGNEGRNGESKSANVLQLYEATQATIPMVMNAQNQDAGRLLRALGAAAPGMPLDDGTRGHVAVTGDYNQLDTTFHARYDLPVHNLIPGHLGLSVAVPVRHAEVKNVKSTDKTPSLYAVDYAVQNQLSTPATLKKLAKDLGGLDLSNWSQTGVGDTAIMFDWSNHYEQDKEGLESVEFLLKLGVSVPTAQSRDEDKAFSLALGNDGAWSMPIGMGLNLDFKHHVRFGGEFELEAIFKHSKTRRMLTEAHQTRFLLLNKGDATLDSGLSWKFNLFLQAFRFYGGLSGKVAYQYFKHDDDRLTPKLNQFDSTIVNSAKWLNEWNMHNVVFQLNWDAGCCQATRNWPVAPQLSLFYKLPITGKNVINPHSFGGQLALNF